MIDIFESDVGWDVRALVDAVVSRVCFDSGLLLTLIRDDAESEIAIGCVFEYQHGRQKVEFTPPFDASSNVGALVSLRSERVTQCVVTRDGALNVDFESERSLKAYPDPDVEAWQVSMAPGGFLVVAPGGDVSIWTDENGPTD